MRHRLGPLTARKGNHTMTAHELSMTLHELFAVMTLGGLLYPVLGVIGAGILLWIVSALIR